MKHPNPTPAQLMNDPQLSRAYEPQVVDVSASEIETTCSGCDRWHDSPLTGRVIFSYWQVNFSQGCLAGVASLVDSAKNSYKGVAHSQGESIRLGFHSRIKR